MLDLAGLIEQAVVGLGYELADFETSPRARLLRIFIDKPNGVSVDDCSAVSHHLSRLFEVENVDYDRLEVSSPGLDRAIKKAADWTRFAGCEVQVKLRMPVGNQRNFVGNIVGLRDDHVVLRVGAENREFALNGIDKARLVPNFAQNLSAGGKH